MQSFEAALSACPELVQARFSLANLLREQGKTAQAIEHYRAALAAEPQHARLWNNLGCALQSLGRASEAAGAFREAVNADPGYGIGYKNLGNMQRELGALEEARGSYERALELLPGDAEVAHYLDAVRSETPERAPAEYVARMFDAFASKFDDTLVNKLGYRTPQRLLDALKTARAGKLHPMRVLDMGCGTGLFGQKLRGLAGHITGVDLSSEMIEKARQRGCYDELLVRDLLDYLADAPHGSFDLAAAVDVFVYLGELSQVFRRTRDLLGPGGLFAYSVEANLHSERDFELLPTGRYAHRKPYLARLAQEAGFTELYCRLEGLREEKGASVQGYVCVLERGA
jgi:predicted TPR repeat methyltransferase